MKTISHQFNKSEIQLVAAWAAGVAITGITKAAPAVVTSVAHGLVTGDVVQITDVEGMLEANGIWIVAKLTDDTYSLIGTDSTGWGTFAGEDGEGAKATFTQWCEVTSFNRQGGAKAETQVSSVCSDAVEVQLGLPDYGTAAIATNWSPDTAMQGLIDDSYDDSTLLPIRYRPKGAKTRTTLLGFVSQTSENGQNGGIWSGSVSYRITGKPIRTLAAA